MSNIVCLDLSAPRKAITKIFNNAMFDFRVKHSEKEIKTIIKYTETAIFVTFIIANPTPVMAIPKALDIAKKFDPIVELIQGLGYPICLCSMTAGAVTMAFNKRKGISLIKDSAIAYLAVQLAPVIMKLLMLN